MYTDFWAILIVLQDKCSEFLLIQQDYDNFHKIDISTYTYKI